MVLTCCACVGNAFVDLPPFSSSVGTRMNENFSLLTMALKRDMSQLPSGGRPNESSPMSYSSNLSPQGQWQQQQQQQQQRNGLSPRDYYYSNFSQQQDQRRQNGYRRASPTSPFKDWLEKARELVGGSSSQQQYPTNSNRYQDSNYYSYLQYDRLQQEKDRKGFRRLQQPTYYQQDSADTRYLKKDMSHISRTFSDHPREYDSTFSFRKDDGSIDYREQVEFRRIALGGQSLRRPAAGEWPGAAYYYYNNNSPQGLLKQDIATVRTTAIENPTDLDDNAKFSFRRRRRQGNNNNNNNNSLLSVEDKNWKRNSLKNDIARVMEDRRGRNQSSSSTPPPVYYTPPYANDRLLAQKQQAGFRRLSSRAGGGGGGVDQQQQPITMIPQGLKRDIAQVPDNSSGGSILSLQNARRDYEYEYFDQRIMSPQNDYENWSDRRQQQQRDSRNNNNSSSSSSSGGRPSSLYEYDDAPYSTSYQQPYNNRMLSRQERRNEMRRKFTGRKAGPDWLEKAREFVKDITRLRS